MWIRGPTSTASIGSNGSRVCRPERAAARRRVRAPVEELLPAAESLTLAGFGETVTYSRKVFIPLTQLCRDVCH